MHTPQLRSEADIRQLAKNAPKLVPREVPSVDTSRLAALVSDVLFTANASFISLAHRGAACNLLSTLLLNFDAHPLDKVKSLVWTNDTWVSCFKFVIAHFSDSKPKPMKQLLGSLIAILKKRLNDTYATSSRKWLVQYLAGVFEVYGSSAPPKGRIYALTLALTKGIVHLDEIVCDGYKQHALSWAMHDELGPSLASLVTSIIQTNGGANLESWHQPLILGYTNNANVQSCYRHYILPAMFSKNAEGLASFLHALDIIRCFNTTADHDLHAELAMSTLLVANSAGLIKIDTVAESSQPVFDGACTILSLAWLSHLFNSQSKVARLGSLALIVDNGSPTEPFEGRVLDLLSERLPVMFADTDADFRSDLLSLIQRIIERLRASSAALFKKNDARLELQKTFLRKWSTVLQAQLRPNASYQRHVCALQCLLILVKSGIDSVVSPEYWSKAAKSQQHSGFHITLFDSSLRTILLSLLMDSFDDVRGLAMSILQAIGADSHGDKASLRALSSFGQLAEQQFADSGRADHADGVARTYALLFSAAPSQHRHTMIEWWSSKPAILGRLLDAYDNALATAENDIGNAIHGQLLHSTIIGLRYIIEGKGTITLEEQKILLSSATKRVLSSIETTWAVVRNVLCDDAPEGYVLDETEEDDADMDSKSVLSFCWRALKEASLLQRAMLTYLFSMQHTPPDVLQVYKHQLDLCFRQLIELRHRGAFSTVAHSFLACFSLFSRNYPEDTASIKGFYVRVMDSIRNASTINTRRSAGLPAALAGILSSSESNDFFATAVSDLTNIASETTPLPVKDHQALPQVHALNCLRELFKHSKLGQRSEEYIPRSLALAGKCLASDLWGIRNSGLMLFRSLIDRLLGTNESYDDDSSNPRAKDLLSKFPELLDLVMDLLDTSTSLTDDLSSVEKVFPALQILQRVSPPTDRLDRVCDAVAALTKSPQWHVRDKAAHAYSRLQNGPDMLSHWRKCLFWSVADENSQHGQLLCLRYVLGRQQQLSSDVALEVATDVAKVLECCYAKASSEVVFAVAVDLWILARRIIPSSVDVHVDFGHDLGPSWPHELLISRSSDDEMSSVHPTSLLTRSLARALLYQKNHSEDLALIVESLVVSDADACTALFDEAAVSFHIPNANRETITASIPLATELLANRAANVPVLTLKAAMHLLIAALAERTDTVKSLWRNGLFPVTDLVLALNSTPLLHDSALVLAGSLLEYSLHDPDVPHACTLSSLRHWLGLLRLAIQEDQPFDTRLAAAEALDILRDSIPTLAQDPESSNILIELALIVYDLTNDDDDEVRDLAASTASRLYTAGTSLQSTIPTAAGSALLHRLFLSNKTSPYLLERCISKLTESLASLCLPTQNPTLFAREKQNLYIDLAREAKTFSRLALRMDKSSLPPSVVDLQRWTLAGAATLSDSLSPSTFAADVFVLVLRVIYTAEILLVWRRKHGLDSVDSASLRQALVAMVEKLKTGHPLLYEEGSRVLCDELLSGAERVGARLGTVPMP